MRKTLTIKKLNKEVNFKMRKLVLIAALAALTVMATATLALADHSWFQGNARTIYGTSTANAVAQYSAASNCIICHTTGGQDSTDPQMASSNRNLTRTMGPHGGYTTTTRRCAACHVIHSNVNNNNRTAPVAKLLPGNTVTGVCSFCHDLTGSENSVYATYYMANPAATVKSAHYVEGATAGAGLDYYSFDAALTSPATALAAGGPLRMPTDSIPGGNISTGGTRLYAGLFEEGDWSTNGSAKQFTCDSCHTPHAIVGSTVDQYFGENPRKVSSMYAFASSRLLKNKLTVNGATYQTYGSDWCGGCHMGRMTMAGSNYNHPVNSNGAGYDIGLIATATTLASSTEAAAINVYGHSAAQINAGFDLNTVGTYTAHGLADKIVVYTADLALVTTYVGFDTQPIDLATNRVMNMYPSFNSWYAMTSGDALTNNAPRPDGYIPISNFAVNGGPSCQQCHASTRNVEISFVDNETAGMHFSFPHIGSAAYLLVEQNTDDLCTNCHGLDNLP